MARDTKQERGSIYFQIAVNLASKSNLAYGPNYHTQPLTVLKSVKPT